MFSPPCCQVYKIVFQITSLYQVRVELSCIYSSWRKEYVPSSCMPLGSKVISGIQDPSGSSSPFTLKSNFLIILLYAASSILIYKVNLLHLLAFVSRSRKCSFSQIQLVFEAAQGSYILLKCQVYFCSIIYCLTHHFTGKQLADLFSL